MEGFLSSIFTKSAPRSEADSIARATGGTSVAYGGLGGLGQVGAWDIDKAVKAGLEKITWVFRAVDVIATSQARLPIRTGRHVNGKPVIVENRDLYDLLNRRSNPYELSWQFRYRLSTILLLSKRGAFIEVVNGRDGTPAQLHLLPPGMTEPIPDPYTFVKGYRVQRGDWQVDELPPERVIWIRLKPHPTDPYSQMTPLTTAGLTAETDYYARLFNRNFIANGAKPGLLIGVQGQLAQEDADELKQRFSGGPQQAGRTSVIEAENISVTDLSGSPADMQWTELLTTSKEEILMAFGVPESVMGNASGRTFDNADAERENFWIDTMIGHCDAIANSMDALTGNERDDVVLMYDYEGIDVLQRMEQRRRAEAREEVQQGLRTIDEYLEQTERPQWKIPATQALWRPGNVVIAQDEAGQEEVNKLRPLGQPDPGGMFGQPGMDAGGAGADSFGGFEEPDADVEEKRAFARAHRRRAAREHKAASTDKEGDQDDHPYMADRLHLEGQVEGILAAWDDRQESVVIERLDHAKFRKGTRHWEDEEGAEEKALLDGIRRRIIRRLNPDYAVESKRWINDLETVLSRVLVRTIRKEAMKVAEEMINDGVLDDLRDVRSRNKLVRLFGPDYEAVLGQIFESCMGVVRQAAATQSGRVRDRIATLDEEGKSIKQIGQEIRRLIGRRSPWRKQLAINVVTAAIEGTRERAYEEAAGRYVKVWRSRMDDRVRHTHRAANGQQQPVSARFRVGAAFLLFPGDPAGPVGETINCRCYIEYRRTPSSRKVK